MLFLAPPILLAIVAFLLQQDIAPLHQFWAAVAHQDWAAGLFGSLLGGLVGGGIVWMTRIVGSFGFGKEAMGLGDVDLMFGRANHWPSAAVVAFFLAPFFGMPLVLSMLLFKSTRQLPFGPYLSMATAFLMLFYFPIYERLLPGLLGLETLLRSLI